jgi:hypothetical protein
VIVRSALRCRLLAHPSRGNGREGRPVTARKRTLALSHSLAARERARIAELDQEIDRLQRTEEAIVVATGAPRERGCAEWVVLGHFAGGRDGTCRPGASAPLPFAHTGKSCSLIPELPAGRAEVLFAAAPMPSASIALRPSNSRSNSIHIAPSRPISRA